MTEAKVQKEMLDTLTGIREDVDHLKKDMHQVMEYLEDTRLTAEEKRMVDECIAKIQKGDESSFISHEDLKKELGL